MSMKKKEQIVLLKERVNSLIDELDEQEVNLTLAFFLGVMLWVGIGAFVYVLVC